MLKAFGEVLRGARMKEREKESARKIRLLCGNGTHAVPQRRWLFSERRSGSPLSWSSRRRTTRAREIEKVKEIGLV